MHHLIKEAVNVALTEVINQEREKDESFFGFIQRRNHGRNSHENEHDMRADLRDFAGNGDQPADQSPF